MFFNIHGNWLPDFPFIKNYSGFPLKKFSIFTISFVTFKSLLGCAAIAFEIQKQFNLFLS